MPELPEVETVARQIAPMLDGRKVVGLRILDPLLRRARTPRVAGRRIRVVRRSGKRVLIEFFTPAAGSVWLAVHLRMTGRLVWLDRKTSVQESRVRARFALDRGALLFLDTRRLGTFDWYRAAEDAEPAGLDPLSDRFTPSALARLMEESGQEVKVWLMRQDRLAGLGNIYASEILHAARVSPFRAAGTLDRNEIRRVHAWTRRILRAAVANCGTTFSDFQDSRGRIGSYQAYLQVYGRGEQPCRRCGEPIRRTVQQQRSTYDCSSCQI